MFEFVCEICHLPCRKRLTKTSSKTKCSVCLGRERWRAYKKSPKGRKTRAAWSEVNITRIRQYGKAHYQRLKNNPTKIEQIRIRSRIWQQENPEKVKNSRKNHYLNNITYFVNKSRNRKKHIRHATPPWADMDAIAAIYTKARQMTEETGIQYEVDHIIPLRGKNVCGLHIAENLQIITKYENASKHNKFLGRR